MVLYDVPRRTDAELRALLQLLVESKGHCGDPLLEGNSSDTGFVRRDSVNEVVLHLTPEGRRFLQG